jgi:hypothetical protein
MELTLTLCQPREPGFDPDLLLNGVIRGFFTFDSPEAWYIDVFDQI